MTLKRKKIFEKPLFENVECQCIGAHMKIQFVAYM